MVGGHRNASELLSNFSVVQILNFTQEKATNFNLFTHSEQ